MKTVVCRLDLGFTRIAGYILYDSDKMEFQEMTPKMAENLVRMHCVNGLIFDKDGELVPDLEGWNLGNIKIKSGVGNYRDFNTVEPRGEKVYSVVRALRLNDDNVIFELINNKCARVFYTVKQVIALAQFHWVGGVTVDPENCEITTCKGVIFEDIADQQYVFEVNGKVYPKDSIVPPVDVDAYEAEHPLTEEELQKEPVTLEDLFANAPVGSVADVEAAEEPAVPKSKKKK